jgi:hypothetical protein
MHLDLVESLRCPNAHEDGWLVAIPDVVRDRVIWTGDIGCPTCETSWRVHDGVLTLVRGGASLVASPSVSADRSGEEVDAGAEAMRTAALLNLVSPGGVVLLAGAHTQYATALAALVPDVLVLMLNAPTNLPALHGHLCAEAPLPLGVGTLRGARVDHAHASSAWLASVHRALARDARLIAPTRAALPDGTRELARDEHEWVAEVGVAASGLVPLRRGGDPLTR